MFDDHPRKQVRIISPFPSLARSWISTTYVQVMEQKSTQWLIQEKVTSANSDCLVMTCSHCTTKPNWTGRRPGDHAEWTTLHTAETWQISTLMRGMIAESRRASRRLHLMSFGFARSMICMQHAARANDWDSRPDHCLIHSGVSSL